LGENAVASWIENASAEELQAFIEGGPDISAA